MTEILKRVSFYGNIEKGAGWVHMKPLNRDQVSEDLLKRYIDFWNPKTRQYMYDKTPSDYEGIKDVFLNIFLSQKSFFWLLYLNNQLCGDLGLNQEDDGSYNLAYYNYNLQSRNKGVVRTSLKMLLDFLRNNQLKMTIMTAVNIDNTPSILLLQKLGIYPVATHGGDFVFKIFTPQ